MRAMLLLVLLLALMALFSFHEPLAPFWKSRFPAVMSCLDEGQYRDAWEAATAGDAPGVKSTRWAKSEPLGETAAVDEDTAAGDTAPAEEAPSEEGLTPADTTEPVEEATSGM